MRWCSLREAFIQFQVPNGPQYSCGFPPTPTIGRTWPSRSGADLDAIVWKDDLNRTFAVDASSMALPSPLPELTESSSSDAVSCSGLSCPSGSTYWVKAASADGSHSLARLELVEVTLDHFLVEARWGTEGVRGTSQVSSTWRFKPTCL